MVRRGVLDVGSSDGRSDRRANRRVQRAGRGIAGFVIRPLAITQPGIAQRVVELQRAAYAVEAELIGFDGIPPLRDTVDDVLAHAIEWIGAFAGPLLVGGIGFVDEASCRVIDRLFVDPLWARRGIGKGLVCSVLVAGPVRVSTGTANTPARSLYESLGFGSEGKREIAPGVTVTRYLRPGPGSPPQFL